MLKIIRFHVFLILFLLSFNALANASFEARAVSQIILHDWGRVLISLKGGLATVESCDSKSFIVLKKDNQFFDEMYSALLAAYHSGSMVAGWVNGCDDRHKSPILTRLDLLPKS